MIQIKKLDDKEEKFQLYIDSVLLDTIKVTNSYSSEHIDITTNNFEDTQKILNNSWNDFPNLIGVNLRLQKVGLFTVNLLAEIERTKRQKKIYIAFGFEVLMTEWKGFYSFREYIEEYKKLWNKIENFNGELQFYEDDVVEYEITFPIVFRNDKIVNLIAPFEKLLKDIHQRTEKNLLLRNNPERYIEVFNFPEELKVPCEQYLLYFAQFLQDLGINAISKIKEEAGRVLFSVTPTDDIEALDKIREALAIYLKLPESPIIYNESFEAMRLQQQIENLQHSQRMAARELQFTERLLIAQSETIQEKNLTISQQQSVLEQQNKILEKITSKSIMMDSLENKEELEEVYDGVKIGESKLLKEKLGVHLNPAKAIKTAVKNTFGKDEKKSVLGLEQED